MDLITLDSLPHLLNILLDRIRCRISTGGALLKAWWWNIEVGKGCLFYGVPIVQRLPGTSITIGKSCVFRSAEWSNYAGINHPCILASLATGAKITIGENCGLSGAAIGAAVSVEIGSRVMVGANTMICDTDWHPVDSCRRYRGEPGDAARVIIGDDVWLGANVVVLKGVDIGAGAVIAANSVVTRSIPPSVVAGGIPARPLKKIPLSGPVFGESAEK